MGTKLLKLVLFNMTTFNLKDFVKSYEFKMTLIEKIRITKSS